VNDAGTPFAVAIARLAAAASDRPPSPTRTARSRAESWSGPTEEAILNAVTAAETTVGRADPTVHALPFDRLQEVMRRYGRSG
jgi:hypothetical protein